MVALASAAVALGAAEAGRASLRDAEARWFGAINGLGDRPFVPVWAMMQFGSLGGSLATGTAVAAAGHRRLGVRLAAVGTLAWLGSKAVKPFADRGRPAAVVTTAHVRGREQAGLGYPSGHAAVAVGMAAAAAPHVASRLRAPLWLAAVAAGAARMYVGAHLPLDVAGGVALGVATERAVRVLRGPG